MRVRTAIITHIVIHIGTRFQRNKRRNSAPTSGSPHRKQHRVALKQRARTGSLTRLRGAWAPVGDARGQTPPRRGAHDTIYVEEL